MTNVSPPGVAPKNKRAVVVIAIVVVLVLLIGGGALWLSLRNNDQRAGTPTAPASTPAPTSVAPSTTPSRSEPTSPRTSPTSPAPSPTPTSARPNALTAVRPFLRAADTMDSQLRAAAAAVNAAGPPWTTVSPRIAALVRAADREAVAREIPPGMPAELRRSVILTYSDLSSRWHAMSSFSHAGVVDRPTPEMLRALANGHPAAERFAGDLAATRSVAIASAPLGSSARDSRQAAEVAILVTYVDLANGGCDSHGGFIATTVPELRWNGDSRTSGTVGGIAFTVRFADDDWEVQLAAC